jgi:hypothetical protein
MRPENGVPGEILASIEKTRSGLQSGFCRAGRGSGRRPPAYRWRELGQGALDPEGIS